MEIGTKTKPSAEPIRFLGVRVNRLGVAELNSLVVAGVESGQKLVIGNHNLHSLYMVHHDEEMRIFHDEIVDYAHIDGMGIVMLGRILGHGLRREDRVTYVDWTNPLLEEAESRRWRVYYLGMRSSVCAKIPEVLQEAMPNVNFRAGRWDADCREVDEMNEEILLEIEAFQPQLLFVGMGMPRQERWILENYDRIGANVILTCGAAMDYVVGIVPTPPRWTGRYGVEWLFRLISQPRHLWRRYLVEPWYILGLLLLEMAGFEKR